MPTSAPETVSAKPRGKAGRPRKEHKQPYLRGEIVRVYATTGSLTETSKALGIDRGTVADIFARNPDDFSTAQKLHAKNLYSDADTCRDLSMQPERLAECSSPQLAVMSGIYTQRAGEILSGPIGKLSAPYHPVLPITALPPPWPVPWLSWSTLVRLRLLSQGQLRKWN